MKKALLFFVSILLTASCMEDAQICINKNLIDTNYICDSVYKPVCGCNNITYYNANDAEKKAGISIYTEGQCKHVCTYNDTLMVFATTENCTLLTDEANVYYEVDYAPTNSTWIKDEYYLLNTIESNSTTNCGGEKSINILCALNYNLSCTALINTTGVDTQLPNDSLIIEEINIVNNCLNVDYSYLGGCDDTRLNLHHLVDSSSAELHRLQFRYDNGNGPCDETIIENTSFNLSDLKIEGQNSVMLSIDCNGDLTFNQIIQYNY